jgi:hypothetical protein
MKRKLFALCCVLCVVQCAQSSKTFFSIPVPFHPVSVERVTMLHDYMHDRVKGRRHTFSVTCFAGGSTDSRKLARYFLPFNKEDLVAGELGSSAVKNYDADLIANYFDVLTGVACNETSVNENNIFDIISTWTFQSTLRFRPRHVYWGFGLLYHYHMSSELDKGWWLEVAMPIMGIKNDMRMSEVVITKGGKHGDDPQDARSFFPVSKDSMAARNMTQALRGSVFRYGKIDECEYKKVKWGVADIEARIGYSYMRNPRYHLSGYTGVLAPTGNKVEGVHMFEKVIGYNGHTGFFFGIFGGINVWSHNDNRFALEFDTGSTLFLDTTQVRSIDPHGKPWGRYIWVYPNSSDSARLSPGINYFTKPVRVSHGSIRALNLAWVYTLSNFQGEMGYHFYSRDREKVRLAGIRDIDRGGFAARWNKDNNFITDGEPRVTRNSATIDNYTRVTNDIIEFKAPPVEDTFLYINRSDIDLSSAEHPAVITHTIYVSLRHGWYEARYPTVLSFAGGYEFGDSSAAMNRWKIWANLSASF